MGPRRRVVDQFSELLFFVPVRVQFEGSGSRGKTKNPSVGDGNYKNNKTPADGGTGHVERGASGDGRDFIYIINYALARGPPRLCGLEWGPTFEG